MENATIENAQYIVSAMDATLKSIQATIDGIQMSVPLDPANRHYAEIQRQVAEGILVVQPANEN